jgi:hypothetical protein
MMGQRRPSSTSSSSLSWVTEEWLQGSTGNEIGGGETTIARAVSFSFLLSLLTLVFLITTAARGQGRQEQMAR